MQQKNNQTIQHSNERTSSPLADSVAGYGALSAAFKGAGAELPQSGVFGVTAGNPRPPLSPISGMKLALHQGFYVVFPQAELVKNSVERGAVLPGHLDDAVNFFRTYLFSLCRHGIETIGGRKKFF
jgi:hypothetical protein